MPKSLLIALAFLPWTASAFEISGTVTDDQNQPVEGAAVRVQARQISSLSDANGLYHLIDPGVPVSTQTSVHVTVGKPGYAAGDRTFTEDGLQNVVLMLRSVEPD